MITKQWKPLVIFTPVSVDMDTFFTTPYKIAPTFPRQEASEYVKENTYCKESKEPF